MKSLSCGIVVVNAAEEVLLCHATGTSHWDIPKGGAEAGETALEAALRETREEAGLIFAPEALAELGELHYRRAKSLHLYAALTARFDPARCRCTSHYTDGWGRLRPEMDAFEWTPFARVPLRCARRLTELLTQTLPLPALLLRLAGQPVAVPRFVADGPVRES